MSPGTRIFTGGERAAIEAVARGWSNVEYDLEAGSRGNRHGHLAGLLRDLTGAEAAVVVDDTKGDVDIKEAKSEVNVVTITNDTTNKGINKETIIKATTRNKATIMTIVTTTIKVGVTIQDLPRDKVKVKEETTILPRVETKKWRAITLITLNKVIQVLMASALLDI